MKLQKEIHLYEYVIAFYFVLQILKPSEFSTFSPFTGFLALMVMKYIYEGFRVSTFILTICQLVLSATSSPPFQFLAVGFAFFAIVYFPVYKYPESTGTYRVGYRRFLMNHLRVAVFYPTTERGKDVNYYPHDEHWVRFYEIMKLGEVISQGKRKYPIPKIVHKLVLSGLERKKLGVNYRAKIIENENGFPVLIFSHGLSANRHAYTVFLKEWASHGFIVMSLEHDENVLIRPRDNNHAVEIRAGQLKHRVTYVKDLLHIVHDHKKMQEILDTPNLRINYSQVFLGGHSFGGATVSQAAVQDSRVTGGLVLLDPWFEACEEEIYTKSLNIPVIVLRSHTFENLPLLKSLDLKYAKINSKNENAVSGYFQKSTHHSVTDMVLNLPKELFIFGMISDLQDIQDQMEYHLVITRIFLQVALGSKEKIRSTVVQRFEEYLGVSKKQNLFAIDSF